MRYRAAGAAFVIRTMTVVHHAEARYGEALTGRTWVRRFRRGMLSTREVRLDAARGPIASGTQEWVHVSPELSPVRASPELVEAFPLHDEPDSPPAELPEVATPREGVPFRFEVEAWWTWMDPLDHVNHPAYVDWCDEGISRRMAAAGLAPVTLQPVAETLTYFRGVVAGERVDVVGRLVGATAAGDAVIEHRIERGETIYAKGRSVRRCVDAADPARLVDALAGARES